MRKWLSFVSLVVMLLVPASVSAQGNIRLSSVDVSLWPEYDKPAMLVIYHIALAPETVLPVDVSLRLPAQAIINAVATRDGDGALLNANYGLQVAGEWVVLSLTTSNINVQVEYYENLTHLDATARHYVYRWAGDYTVDSFTVHLQQPVDTISLVTTPEMAVAELGADGFYYYTLPERSLAVGQTFELSVDYQKSSDALSASGLPVQAGSPVGLETAGRTDFNSMLPWLLIGLGVVVIGAIGGLWWYWRSSRSSEASPRKRHARRTDEEEVTAAGLIHCHECGRRAQPRDQFCRACGTRLRGAG